MSILDKKRSQVMNIEYVLILIAVALTGIRIYLGIKTPLFLQADAGYDDFLFIRYAESLLKGEWLGAFGSIALVKSASYSMLLVIGYLLGISYSVALTVGYIFAVFLFVKSLSKLFNNRYFDICLYIFLIYSPTMFHEENVQKVYRGGYIVIFALLTIASVIGLYTRVNEERKKVIGWSILGCICLPLFWFLKEDSIWILPFVIVGNILTLIEMWKSKETIKRFVKHALIVILPVLCLGLSIVSYKAINYHYYGEYTVTDRSGTYYKEVI